MIIFLNFVSIQQLIKFMLQKILKLFNNYKKSHGNLKKIICHSRKFNGQQLPMWYNLSGQAQAGLISQNYTIKQFW